MKNIPLQFAVFVFALAPLWVRAGGDEVVVIYNSRLPESKAVAEYYAHARQVPDNQIYGFAMTTNEEMSRPEFHDSLQMPLAKKLEADKLWQFGSVAIPATNGQPRRVVRRVAMSKIRYAVLCYGVPLKISVDLELREPVNTNQLPQLHRNEAAVDSELAWLPMIEMNPPITGPMPNRVYGITNAAWLNPTNGMLLVARLDGPTAGIARGLVDKALQAERDGLWGRAYFDARGLIQNQSQTNYWLGDEWILGAAQISHALGFETVVDNTPDLFPASFPMSQIAIYAGWYAGDVCGPFQLPKVEFMPGAFAYHLHSNSATTIRETNGGWVGPLVARGATCTMGCVYEPYLQFTPNVAFFLQSFGNGFTFGEAAWASAVALSWQTTVIGDPLYQPFKKAPLELHAQLARAKNPLIEWSFERLLNLDILHGVRIPQLAAFLENLPATAKSAVLTEKLAGLYDSLGKPSSAVATWQNALKLAPSPQQRIRIRLVLAEKLVEQGREADAAEDWRQLIAEAPDYPGKPAIEEKLKAFAEKSAGTNASAKP